MKTPRLVPTLIVAATALLVLKTIGLVTDGGYVLVGSSPAMAEGGGDGEHGGAAPEEGEASTDVTMPGEHTLEDTSPTIADTDETLPLEAEAEAAAGHGGSSEAEAADEPIVGPEATEASAAGTLPFCPPGEPDAAVEAPAGGGGEAAADAAPADCLPVADNGMPVILDGTGAVIPMVDSTVGASQPVLVERLGERREALDVQAAELEMRMSLVEAAEMRLDQRTAELKALEAKINALVDQQKSVEREQFVSLVAMYETMKPKEAALIFDALDLPVLVRVAQAIDPKRMGLIMAKMDPNKAKSLTSMLVAAQTSEPKLADAPTAGELPQIVGQ